MKYIRDIIYIIVIIMLTVLCFHFELKKPDTIVKTETIVKTDTVIKYDTITITAEKIKYVDRKIIDTVFIKDETKLFVEQIHYNDDYSDIFVSGVLPKVDSVSYKIPEKIIYVDKVIEVPKKDSFWKNRFVVTAGFSVQYGLVYRNFDVGPAVTVGIRLY